MAVYCDTPRWERWHGLSGHLIADSTAELSEFANRLGISAECASLDSVVPHYQIAATLQAAALAAGAILLSDVEFSARLRGIHRAHRPIRPSASARIKRQKKPRSGARAAPRVDQEAIQGTLF